MWFDHNLICIVRWHLEIREANTITDVIKKSTSWLRGAFFHRPEKKDNSFLIFSKTITHSLPFPCRKKKTTQLWVFLFCFFCGLLLAKEDIDVPLQEAALQEMCSLVRMISQQASKEVYLMWSQRQKGSGTETNKMTQRQQKDSWHLIQVTLFLLNSYYRMCCDLKCNAI